MNSDSKTTSAYHTVIDGINFFHLYDLYVKDYRHYGLEPVDFVRFLSIAQAHVRAVVFSEEPTLISYSGGLLITKGLNEDGTTTIDVSYKSIYNSVTVKLPESYGILEDEIIT